MKKESQKVFNDYEKTENKLKATNQQLTATEQQLRAMNLQLTANNQQLQATEQQLRAANQQLRASEELAQTALQYADNIIDTLREPFLILDHDLKVVSANQSFYNNFKISVKNTIGRYIYELGNNQWDIPALRKLLEDILPEKTIITDYEVEHTFDEIGRKIMLLNVKQLIRKKGEEELILFAIEDITMKREAEEKLKATNQQLMAIEQQLRAANQQLDANNQQLLANENVIKKQAHDLGERVKELNCLYGISEIVSNKETIEEILQDTANIIPSSWKFPKITCAKIILRNKEFKTSNYKDSNWQLSSKIIVDKEVAGKVVVGYLEETPEFEFGPFLKKEKRLIQSISERLGRVIERKEAVHKANTFFNTVVGGMRLIDYDYNIRDVNNLFCEMVALPESEIIGKKCYDVFWSKLCKTENCPLAKLQNSDDAIFEKEITNIRLDGKEIPTIMKATHYKNIQGDFVGIIEDFKDITERKQAEEALRLSSLATNTSLSAIFTTDLKGIITYANSSAAKMWGYESTSEMIGTNILAYWNESSQTKAREMIETLLRDGLGATSGDLVGKKLDGTEFSVESNSIVIKDENGRNIGLIGSFVDITERKLAEEQIKKDLKIKTALIQEIYHRTRNNMAVISAMLAMESGRSENDQVKSTFREIDNKIRAMSMVHQKLYEAKDLSSINMEDYIKDLVELIMQSYGVFSERATLNFDLHAVKVSIDSAVPFGLIINELISNIFKHAFPEDRKGEISIRLFKEEDETINLELMDNGIGFSQNFDPRKDGSMGLALVFSIAEEQLKGEISVKSENGLKWHIKIKDNLHKERV